MKKGTLTVRLTIRKGEYADLLGGVTALLEDARHAAARSVNAILTATYWEVGRRTVEFEQRGSPRAEYGERLLERLASDLTARFGRGFGLSNLKHMKKFYLSYKERGKGQAVSGLLAGMGRKKGHTAHEQGGGGIGIGRTPDVLPPSLVALRAATGAGRSPQARILRGGISSWCVVCATARPPDQC